MSVASAAYKQDKLPVPDCQAELERTPEVVAVSDIQGRARGEQSPLVSSDKRRGGGDFSPGGL
ncbi:hypothetical protein ES705_25488 [subsurface metagenome]